MSNWDCKFAKNGECTALACFSDQLCTGRDDNGNPKYTDDRQKESEGEGNDSV